MRLNLALTAAQSAQLSATMRRATPPSFAAYFARIGSHDAMIERRRQRLAGEINQPRRRRRKALHP